MTTGTEPSELERVKKELETEHDMYLRSLADFDNYRRRVERDREGATRRGKRDLLLSMVDLLDGFERALPHMSGAPAPALEGIMAIYRQLLNSLEAQGVTPFDT